jgi:hypothetical protein
MHSFTKYTEVGIFGKKLTYHLATLLANPT